LLCLPAAGADRTIGQFVHTVWVAKDGAPANITAIAQTTDGYLWLASSQGLYRFDGVEFEREEAGSRPAPLDSVYSLLACANGDLWAGSAVAGISRLRNGTNRNYSAADGFPDRAVLSIAQNREGAIWAATQGGLVRFDGRRWRTFGPESGFEGSPISLYADRHGTLWAATADAIFYLTPGAGTFQRAGFQAAWAMHMLESPNGTMWVAETTRYVRPMPPSPGPEIMLGSQRILFDRDGSLWITTLGDGLRRVEHPDRLTYKRIGKSSDQLDSFTANRGLSADYVTAIYQDREGNVWVGTSAGLDRFTKGAVAPGPPASAHLTRMTIAPDTGGDVWLGDLSGHVGRIHDNQWFPHLGLICFSATPDPNGGTWLAEYHRAYREINGRFTPTQFPHPYEHNAQPVRIAVDSSGALWISGSSGVFARRHSEWIAVDLPIGFPGKTPSLAYADAAGRVWFGFKENAILLIDGNAQRVLSEKDGLHAGAILAISVRGAATWVAGSNGLQFLDGERFRDISLPDGGTFGSISGVAETSDGSLWLNAYNGIIHVSPAQVSKLKAGENRAEYTRFDAYDGLPGPTQQGQPYPSLIQATDGKLWFATSAGPVWIDPNDIPHNPLPPPVTIRSITARGKRYASFANLRLPKLTRDLDIAYTALSLTVPARVHFRYMLEGSDKDWREGGAQRQASYTNLGPGTYRFRVMASNNDGIWNQAGAVVGFRIDSAFYQTFWFEAACCAGGLWLLWLFYQYRLRMATSQVQSRLEGQIAERERIARELHDTLLQSFQGLMLRLQVVDDLLPAGEAKEQLEQSLDRADQAISEGRRAVYDLRSSTTAAGDLKESLRAAAAEYAGEGAPVFRLEIEGAARDLHPILCDEVYRIAREGLCNAFTHARAAHVEAEITYGARFLRLRIRDDGVGIPEDILESGRSGHYGLKGMRERARQTGATLEIWSRPKAGTEIDLNIPASIAYANSSKRPGWSLFRGRGVKS